MIENETGFICVECGAVASSLYKKFQQGITKLSQCVSTYIELQI